MKTLSQLQSILSASPCPFAAQGKVSVFPLVDEGAQTNFETGIPSEYSPKEKANTSLMPRGDFNRIGEIATRELFFRSAGGVHTFDTSFASANNGYADRIALVYDDGKFVRTVESQESENDLNFKDYPAVIDALANKPSDIAGTAPRVLWKSASRVYGLAEGLVHVGVDYSRQQTVSSGDSLEHDSFVVIGASYYGLGDEIMGNIDLHTAGAFSISLSLTPPGKTVPVELTWENKGMQGMIAGGVGLIDSRLGPVYPAHLYGGANAPLAFFARKGTVITISAKAGEEPVDKAVSVVAFPMETSIAVEEGEE